MLFHGGVIYFIKLPPPPAVLGDGIGQSRRHDFFVTLSCEDLQVIRLTDRVTVLYCTVYYYIQYYVLIHHNYLLP
jgi:hypothetical protein